MKYSDLAQCGLIYAKAFPIEHWGIDWTAENATEYLQDYFEQKRFVGYVYEENDEVLGCIFALCKISGSQIVLYTSEYAPAAKFYEKNGFKRSNGTICMYCEE